MTPEDVAREFEEIARLHERNRRLHGESRADLARWRGLLRLCAFLYKCERRRRERAMHDALDALERARDAEEGEARWVRVGAWVARRVDAAAARCARRTKLVTRIDFSPAPSIAEYGEAEEPTDVEVEAFLSLQSNAEDEEIKW